MKKLISIFTFVLAMSHLMAQPLDSSVVLQQVRDSFSARSYDNAIILLDKVIAAYPNDVKLLNGKGYAYIMQKRFEEAQAIVFNALEIQPAIKDKINSLVGMTYIVLQVADETEIDQALPYIEKALKLDPKGCMSNLSKILYAEKQGHSKEVIQIFESMNAQCANDPELNLNLNTDVDYIRALYRTSQDDKVFKLLSAMAAEGGTGNFYAEEFYLMELNILYRQGKYKEAWDIVKDLSFDEYSDPALLTLKGAIANLLGMKEEAVNAGASLNASKGGLQDWEAAFENGKKQSIAIKKGTKLTYQVNSSGNEYYFVITFTEYSPNQIAFDWTMGEESKGKVSMDKNSINAAMKMHNYFADGTNDKLSDKITVFFSKAMFDKMRNNDDLKMDTGNGEQAFNFHEPAIQAYSSNASFNYTDAISITDMSGYNKIMVQNDAACPLILYMNLDFEIELRFVE